MSAVSPTERWKRVLERSAELADLESAGGLVAWDQETFMPKKGVDGRSHVIATMAGLVHEKLTDPALGEDLEALTGGGAGLDGTVRDQVAELARLRGRAVKVPADLVRTLAQLQSKSTAVWALARADKDFATFAPYLTRIIELKREVAEAIGYREEPYEALMDEFEPGSRVSDVAHTLEELRDFLIPLVQAITGSSVKPDPGILAGPYDASRQDAFGREVVAAMGFDLEAGRLDLSNHPFTSGIHAGDTRLTTRYKPDLSVGLFGTMHEAGHGLYEQNLPEALRRTPLGTATSLGMHESQSRMWENMVGRGRPFWNHFYARLQAVFPENLGKTPLDAFFLAVNGVRPSYIRIEADEVTYNLHIILRFELERELTSGRLAVKDVSDAWNDRVKRYLGLPAPSVDQGVLQDIHWSSGLIGYFPTYSLGNLYAAQLFEAARRDIPGLEAGFEKGKLTPLTDWLVENVHRKGRAMSASEIVEKASGAKLSPEPFSRYLRGKFEPLYGL